MRRRHDPELFDRIAKMSPGMARDVDRLRRRIKHQRRMAQTAVIGLLIIMIQIVVLAIMH